MINMITVNGRIHYYRKVRLKTMFALALVLASIVQVQSNRPPRFVIDGGQSEIVLRLKESPETPVGSLIYHLKGYDPDNDQLTFGIIPSQFSDIIRIENFGTNEANVYLAKDLDRETKDEYSLVLTLSDNKFGEYNYVTQSLLLLVVDINDNEPIFKPYQSAIEISENSSPGIITTLEATDKDEGAYGQVMYYLQDMDPDSESFSITTQQGKGVLRLKGDLDYERKNVYQLRVLAVDRSNSGPIHTGTAAILIKVLDEEDQPPEFVQIQAVIRVAEDVKIGTRLTQVKAVDGDRGINNPIKYSIEKNHFFAIDEIMGFIYTTKELDREDLDNQVNGAYIFKIRATEISKTVPRGPFVETEITIFITDVNDETPTFIEEYYRCEISENAQINMPVTFIDDVENSVFDHDVGRNGTFQLFIDPPDDTFEIIPDIAVNEATFIIRVKDPSLLDYEMKTEINFTIIAKEVEAPGKWSAAFVQIFIADQNDNYPEFTQSVYNITIPENSEVGTFITQIKAHDKDSEDFGTMGIRYKNLRGGIAHLLSLDPVVGTLSIKNTNSEAFDREIISRHYLTVEAIDNNGIGNRNTAQIIINIEDVNDNAPIFLQHQYEANLMENKDDFENPLILEARDLDLEDTENSQITYEIVDGMFKSNFTIDPLRGILRPLYPLDFEELINGESQNIINITLFIQARDSGIPSMSNVVPVNIFIQDVNDNPPIFQRGFYSKSIPEDLPGGSSVVQVNAIDRDGSSPNNKVVYRIQSGASDKFIINAESGMIFVAQGASLDPDLTNSKRTIYSLTVLAIDGGLGSMQQMASTVVNITIKDVNNKPPLLTELPILEIPENTPVGTVAYKVIAVDLDDTAILRYSINKRKSEAKNEEGTILKLSDFDYVGAFDLNAVSGILKITKLLDREKVEQIKLGIIAEDLGASNGPQIAEGYINIEIIDENDNNPRFKQPFYKRSVTENSKNGVGIVNVVAYDIDKNRTITYSLEGDPGMTGLIHLDPQTGEVVVANKIDHETHQWLNFTIRATDSGFPPRSSLVEVYVSVIDENDNNPFFATSSKNYTVSEGAPIGTRIATIQAMDLDSGDYGKITFLIDRISSQGKFSIDADTGVLTVADKLDREVKDFYMLVVEAWDNYHFGYMTGESRNAFKQIFINVLDENDNIPELVMPTGCVQITEYHELNEVIAVLHGKDADDPTSVNGKLHFQISKGNFNDLFELRQIDPWTAKVYAKKSLRNRFGNHSLTISCRDLGLPSHTITKTLDICVADFNDHPPVFVSPLHNTTIRIPENSTVGSVIIQVQAVDEDIGVNALVKYRLKPDPLGNYKAFEIDNETGMIFLKEHLNREKQKIYELRIEAYDQGIPNSLSSDLDLTVYIRNVNDYEPQFLVENIFANFTEHLLSGSQKVKLPDTIDKDEVSDLDDPPSMVCYYIIKGNEQQNFHLDPENHILTAEKELDREEIANYTLYVKATEKCSEDPEAYAKTFINSKYMIYKSQEYFAMPFSRSNSSDDVFNRFKHSRNLRHINADQEHPLTMDEILMSDSTIVRVLVTVNDINDNAPEFTSRVFTGGVTTSADFGSKFMRVEAIDRDEGANAKVSYYIEGAIRQTLSEGLENVRSMPFLIDEMTGEIQLNFDPQKGMKGYFDFMVLANDTDGLKDTAHVFIYLLREDQKVRFVFRLQPPELRDRIERFKRTLSNVTDAIVNIDEFKVHENKDGSVDKTKTDLYLHLVDKEDNSIYEVSEVLHMVDRHIELLDDLFKEFNVLDTQPFEAQMLVGTVNKDMMFVWLILSNVFIGILLGLTLMICFTQKKSFKRELRAAKVIGYANNINVNPVDGQSIVPNTNKHSMEGSNPIWLKGYENEEWFKPEEESENASSRGPDSLDDNFLSSSGKLFNRPNDLNRHYMVYNHIEKLTNHAQVLAKKLETTEL